MISYPILWGLFLNHEIRIPKKTTRIQWKVRDPVFFVRGQHGSTSSLEVIAVACRFWPVLCQLSTCTWNAFPHWNSFVKQIRKTMGTSKMVSFLISSTSFSFQTKKIWMIHVWLNIIAIVYPPWTVSHFYHLWILTGSERVLSLSKGLIFESAMAFSTDFTRPGAQPDKRMYKLQ